jgi:hypothetical protein
MSRVRGGFLAALVLLLGACGPCGQGATPVIAPTAKPPAPALLQVDDAPQARPHSGLGKADFVYEYLTEGSITRFTAVFMNPSGSDKIGPVRSARLISLRLQKAYGGPLFYSGASDHVLGQIQSQHVPAFDENSPYFSRDSSRPAPYNLYTTADQLSQGVKKSGLTLSFTPAPHGEPAAGDPAGKFSFQQTPSHKVSYSYDSGSRTYTYTTDTGPEVDAQTNQPFPIVNVVLLQVAHHDAGYTEDVLGETGIDFDLTGSGPADVYTRGKHLTGKWDLSDPTKPPQLLDSKGNALALPAGLTWIHLVDPGSAVFLG